MTANVKIPKIAYSVLVFCGPCLLINNAGPFLDVLASLEEPFLIHSLIQGSSNQQTKI